MSVKTFLDGRVTLHCGDCLDVLAAMPENSVDSVVCDPPYHLTSIVKRFGADGAAEAKRGATGAYQRASAGFMGKQWDGGDIAFQPATWAAVWRVLKPGGHLLAFSATRSYHRMAVAIEDGGFEVRDCIFWCYGSGFPKSHDISKAIDRARDDSADILRVTTFMAEAAERAGVTRSDVDAAMGTSDMGGWWLSRLKHRCQCPKWEQWVQLKSLLLLSDEMDAEVWRLNGRKGQPGEAWQEAEILAVDSRTNEPSGIVGCGRERTAVDRLVKAANSEAARQWVGFGTALKPAVEPICVARKPLSESSIAANVLKWGTGAINIDGCRVGPRGGSPMGRWPANLCHDGSEEVLAGFPETAPSPATVTRGPSTSGHGSSNRSGELQTYPCHGDSGSAARFFYTSKADAEDRIGSRHPTVKPLDLMQYLCRLVTPPGGTILDPFAGTGTTGEAAWREGFNAILIEREPEYQADIARRMDLATKPTKRAAVAKSKNDLRGAEGTPLFGDAA